MSQKKKRKPQVDYREFRFSRIGEPRFRHVLLLGGWLVYFIMYFITENLIPISACHIVHSRLDDLIPFTEIFVIPYCGWFFLVAGSLCWYFFYDVDRFVQLQKYIIILQTVAMLVYIVWPNMQDLRPAVFPRDNLFTDLIGLIYAFDTPTGVCPSQHVAFSLAIVSVYLKDPNICRGWKVFLVFAAALISAATTFIKQHSVIDIVCAFPEALIAELIIFGPWWKKKLTGKAEG